MAKVYILYSRVLNKFYIGSCLDLDKRLEQHRLKIFGDSFSSRANDWELYFVINHLEYKQARLIEKHIKKMKSRKYIEDMKKYPIICEKLRELYR